MSKSFMLFDKNINLQKNADIIVKFNLMEKDYLVYSLEENEQNSQIFVSRLVSNSDGKYFIDNILPEEKGMLSNIVYNIVILVPTDAQKGTSFDDLSNNLLNKFSVKLSLDYPTMDMQEYFSNCSIAITSKILVNSAIKLYEENLNMQKEELVSTVPTWTAPTLVTAPVPTDVTISEPTSLVQDLDNNIVETNTTISSDLSITPVSDSISDTIILPETVESIPATRVSAMSQEDNSNVINSNPQIDKLAIVSDPSLGINVTQPNLGRNKKAGFANTKYIVIGSVCLVLAVAVVITAYILISNIK